jgi:hypothetical protein
MTIKRSAVALHRVLSSLASAALLALPIHAAPLNADHLPKQAKWVLHVDYKAFTDSALAERIRTHRPEIVDQVRNWLTEHCGIDPRKDIESITLFGDNYEEHSGAAVFRGNYDVAKAESHLREKRNVTQTDQDGRTYFTWTMPAGHGVLDPMHQSGDTAAQGSEQRLNDGEESKKFTQDAATSDVQSSSSRPDNEGDRQVTAVLLDGKQAVLAGSLEQAREVVELLKGNEPTLKSDSNLIAAVPEGAFVYGAAIDLGEISQHDRPFPILAQHESIKWYVGERDDEMFETLTLVANERRVAREMETALEGLIAFGKVWAGDLEMLKELYDDTDITRTRRTVEVDWQGDIEDVMAALDELQPRLQAWRLYQGKARK